MKKPYIIVFEGVDRSGKDSLIDKVDQRLNDLNYSSVILRNPDQPVRSLLLSKDTNLNNIENLLVFYAGYLHTERKIDSTDVDFVLINRRLLSTFVYQRIEQENSGLTNESVEHLLNYCPLKTADLTIVIDATNEELIKRTQELELDKDDKYEASLEDLLFRAEVYRELPNIINGDIINRLTQECIFLDNNNFDEQAANVAGLIKMITENANS